ncbi:MAG: hypothetical protein SVU69_00380 [Pseudomonadota bacterium]|nr:hypothetical protein [Pseudomonadota bacterium]
MGLAENFERLLAQGEDNKLIRFSLGQHYLRMQEYAVACEHLRRCLTFDADYSAAWKLYAQALAADGQSEAAVSAYQQGIDVAERNGDQQAAKEMRVFLKRITSPR